MPNKWDEINARNALQRRVGQNVPDSRTLTGAMIGQAEPQTIEKIVEVVPENAIVRRDDGAMVYKRFVMWPVGLEVPEDVTKAELMDVGKVIAGLSTSIQWIVGDWLNAAQMVWGETYQQVAEELGYSINTMYEWARVCGKISIRIEKLSFGHHQAVAAKPSDIQQYWLSLAVQNEWSVEQLREAMQKKPTPQPPPLPHAVVESREANVKRFNKLESFVQGKRTLSREEIQREGEAIIQWVQWLMDSIQE
jgi:hypothetical protein